MRRQVVDMAVLLVLLCGSLGTRATLPTMTGARQLFHHGVPLSHLSKAESDRPGTANCTEHFFTQPLDHFSQEINAPTFEQRYYHCTPRGSAWRPGDPIFFYTGNEAVVTLFVNQTGLMWEHAAQFNATLVFAEHRYFGKSLPFPGEPMPPLSKMQWLTPDQALEDYVALLYGLKQQWNSENSAVIAFGGSYGGVLASWIRIKFPGSVDGSIASSAPVLAFVDMQPPYDPELYARAISFDATAAGGAAQGCEANIRQSWNDVADFAAMGSAGFATLTSIFRTCKPLASLDDVAALQSYLSQVFPYFAMSSYPYPSAYMLLGGAGELPAYPMRVGCEFLGGNFTSAEDRLAGLFQMVLVYYNATGETTCLNPESTVNRETEIGDYLWGYMGCSTMLMPYGENGVTDMFPPSPFNLSATIAECQQAFNVTPAVSWPMIQYGGAGVADWGSNIVFSNGALDAWHLSGISQSHTDAVTSVMIPEMGHHADLMFSDPLDTEALRRARELEVAKIAQWIAAKRDAQFPSTT